MTIALIILAVVFTFVSGFSKAICDLSEEGSLRFKPKKFWIKDLSWINKWQIDNGLISTKKERFWGSSRWFVMFTDGWHLFGLIERIGFIVTYTATGMLISQSAWYWFMLLSYPFSMLVFHIFHDSTNWIKKK